MKVEEKICMNCRHYNDHHANNSSRKFHTGVCSNYEQNQRGVYAVHEKDTCSEWRSFYKKVKNFFRRITLSLMLFSDNPDNPDNFDIMDKLKNQSDKEEE